MTHLDRWHRSSRRERQRGATALTYGLVVGLVALAGLGAVTRIGESTGTLFTSVASSIDGTTPAPVAPSPSPSPSPSPTPTPVAARCQGVRDQGQTSDGRYTIDPDGTGGLDPFEAYCAMRGAEGWTLIANNPQPTTFSNFTRTWAEYKAGFGGPASGSLSLGWIGNDRLHALTDSGVAMEVRTNNYTHAYTAFRVRNESANYTMTVTAGSGSNDGGQFGNHSGYPFSTYDRDNDVWGNNCASYFQTGWWHEACYWMTIAGNNNSHTYWRDPNGAVYYPNYIQMWVR